MSERLFCLPERYESLRAEASELAEGIAEHASVADESSTVDPVMRSALVESGLTALAVPSTYGGRTNQVDSLAITIVREALAGTSAHLDSLFAMQGIGSYALSVAGDPILRRRWLPAVANCDALAGLALTEPQIGSDLKSLETTVVEDGDALVVNGHKSFITNAGDADFFAVLCRDGEGFSLILVPSDTPGVTILKPSQIIAPHVLGDVLLNDVRVDRDHRIGESGAGFRLVLATLATFRVSVAGAAVGVAQAALEDAVSHARKRQQFGQPLMALGAVSQSLARSWVEIEMARSFTYSAAAAAQRDALANLHLSSMAKVAATEICGGVVDRAVQVMGRFGLLQGSRIERLYREARPMRIYEGASEVILDSLARQLAKREFTQSHAGE